MRMAYANNNRRIIHYQQKKGSIKMTDQSIPWEEEALQRLEKIPSFVRNMAKAKIEKAAIAAGEEKVTAKFMDENKAKLMG